MPSVRKVPAAEAFTLYVGLGHVRSYAAVAQQYGVATRGILALAKRHRWAERLREVDQLVLQEGDDEDLEPGGGRR